MDIYVQSAITGNRLELKITNTDTVEELKSNIEILELIPITKQKLLFCSNIMEDTNKVVDYGVTNNSVIQLIIGSDSITIPNNLPQIIPRQYYTDNMVLRHPTPITPRTPFADNNGSRPLSDPGSTTGTIRNFGLNQSPLTPRTPMSNKFSPSNSYSKISPSELIMSDSEFKRKNGPFKLKSPGTKSYCLCTIYISEFKDEKKDVDYFRISYTWEYASADKSDARDCCWCSLGNNNSNTKNRGNPFIALNLEGKMSGLTIEKNELTTTLVKFLVMDDEELETFVRFQHAYDYRKNIMLSLSDLNRTWT